MVSPRQWPPRNSWISFWRPPWEAQPEHTKVSVDRGVWEGEIVAAFRLLCDVETSDPDQLAHRVDVHINDLLRVVILQRGPQRSVKLVQLFRIGRVQRRAEVTQLVDARLQMRRRLTEVSPPRTPKLSPMS